MRVAVALLVGAVQVAARVDLRDECITVTVCDASGQLCVDSDLTTMDSWACECPSPTAGSAMGGVATCTLDECTATCPTCEEDVCAGANQTCVDRSTNASSTNDWDCVCQSPATGSGLTAPAQCILNECAAGLGATCAAAGQACQDPDTSVMDNAICKCQPPSTSTSVGSVVAECHHNECLEYSNNCAVVGQTCVDPDTLLLGDWLCRCVAPQVGPDGMMGPGPCANPDADCDMHGSVCSAAGQSCYDREAPEDGLYECRCVPPATGAAGENALAACVFDECLEQCTTCAYDAVVLMDNVCTNRGQICVDTDTAPNALANWMCQCAAPFSGEAMLSPVASCKLNECTQRCGTCADKGDGAGNECFSGSPPQTCIENSLTLTGDWVCECVTPYQGQRVAALATCQANECIPHESVCLAAGQECVDPNFNVSLDWTCQCQSPSADKAVLGAVAVCTVDECAGLTTCSDVQQECFDPDVARFGDWRCQCPSPATGSQMQGPVATCVLDECTTECAHCANADGKGNVCELNAQTCEDVKSDTKSINDWACTCTTGSASSIASPVPLCVEGTDECTELSGAVKSCEHVARYSSDGCQCSCHWVLSCTGTGCAPQTGPGSSHDEPCVTGCCNPDNELADWCFLADSEYNRNKAGCPLGGWGYCIAFGTTPGDGGVVARASIAGIPDGENNVCTFSEPPQRCVDPDAYNENDWWCECIPPLTGPRGMQSNTTCNYDECDVHGAVCMNAGQACADPVKTADSTDDWICSCTSGDSTAVAMAASCELDECAHDCATCAMMLGENVCEKAGQVCEDNNVQLVSSGDWFCKCVAPSVGMAKGTLATCILDECVSTCPTCEGGVCAAANQTCEDQVVTTGRLGDWHCLCPMPFTGEGVAAVGTCYYDECVELMPCPLDQTCVEPTPSVLGDWECHCRLPTTGFARQATALCELDECATNSVVCTNAGQMCIDSNHLLSDDWVCRCIEPDMGLDAVGEPATCATECELMPCPAGQRCLGSGECACIEPSMPVTGSDPLVCELDECTAVCPTCEQYSSTAPEFCALQLQECVDPNLSQLSDWECRCIAPATGTAGLGSAATCTLDECIMASSICEAAGQTCADPTTGVSATGDWECACAPPSTQTRTAGIVAECTFDECTAAGNADQCTGAVPAQICVDPNPAVTGDWECHCAPPAAGTATNGPAADCDSWNECTVQCDACADNGAGNVCVQTEQTCVDPDTTVVGDWKCVCAVGTGSQVGAPVLIADCILDECATLCPTCADTGAGNLCVLEEQTCEDAMSAADSLGDWQCRCPVPFHDNVAPAGLAVCSLDECAAMVGGAVPGALCATEDQECHDPHPATLGDFICSCLSPSVGQRTAAIASCSMNECLDTANNDTCVTLTPAQACMDPNVTNAGDWMCVCAAPTTGSAVGAAATCSEDECTGSNAQNCGSAVPPQQCVDADTSMKGNWECVCPAPATGRATMTKASCVLDECLGTCATCSLETCASAGQECRDPNRAYSSTSDWICKCASTDGNGAEAIGKVATCVVDECVEHAAVCTQEGQQCVDSDQSPSSTGTWECRCLPPSTGYAIAFAAQCTLDECASYSGTCSSVGQMCVDPNTAAAAVDDWECRCVFPANGTGVTAAAVCNTEGECGYPLVVEVCSAAGQSCSDPDPAVEGDWRCLCIPPSTGATATGGAAACTLDECRVACPTCSNGVCQSMGQLCVDADKDPITGLSSWECRCVEPEYGTALGALAACALNECDVHATTCTIAMQACFDPDSSVANDWKCTCPPPSTGEATGAVATCMYDECTTHAKTCEDAGQACNDISKAAKDTGSWYCECPAPSTGSGLMAVAMCATDECSLYGQVCELAGQTCNDTDTAATGGWFCVCQEPHADVTAEGAAAVCFIDECKDAYPGSAVMVQDGPTTCDAAGQTCSDPDTAPAARWNWMCTCPDGIQTGILAVATCEVDECQQPDVLAICVAEDQGCTDPDFSVANDFQCMCLFPAVGSATAGVATCEEDECTLEGTVCTDAAQLCVDADLSAAGTWECRCPPALGLTAVGMQMPADCTPPPMSECMDDAVRQVCTAVGQLCIDTDLTTAGTWDCRCVEPAYGLVAVGAPTVCSLDECEETCLTCGGTACASAGQVCHDPDTSAGSLNDWSCVCPAPMTGVAKLKAARCLLNECVATCATCANTGAGSVCAMAGQSCIDDDEDARATNTWRCECAPPAVGMASLGAAMCILDECAQNGEACPADQVCTDADPSVASKDDWACTCVPPQIGTAALAAATCALNECNDAAISSTCVAAGQTCVDPNATASSVDDWECHCASGASKGVAGVATCALNECADVCPTCADTGGGNVCVQAEQTCEDPTSDPLMTRDWKCVCASGTVAAVGNVATCELDECAEVSNFGAHTCQHRPRYTMAGCKCMCQWRAANAAADFPGAFGPGIDSPCKAGCCNPNGDAGGDWCFIDKDDPENQGKAECQVSVDTCAAPGAATGENVCADNGQACMDLNHAVTSVLDWQCMCVAPAVGQPVTAGVAYCKTDECRVHGDICAAEGQLCMDPSDAMDDWACTCPPGATGEKVTMAAAACVWEGECVMNAFVCAQVGQTCFDPDYAKDGDWVCSCIAPAVGASAEMAPTVCKLDECTAACSTCAGFTCQAAGQLCEDLSTTPTDLGDWVCKCTGAGTGSRQGAAAVCGVDECLTDGGKNGAVCAQAGQQCVDSDPDAEGTWECACVAPQGGRASGKAASCTLNECLLVDVSSVCTAAGQICEDLNTDALSVSDWACTCLDAEGVYQRAAMGPAECLTSPDSWCALHGDKCRVAGQECVDADDAAAEGACACLPPLYGASETGAPALCFLDECTAQCPSCADNGGGNICTQNEQTCVEGSENPVTGLMDWMCKCDYGGSTALAAVAECRVNECQFNGQVCVGGEQTCTDPDTDPAAVDDWFCSCPPPTVGKQVGGLAECTFDECYIHSAECSIAGQVCRDPALAVADSNDWMCVCVGDGVGEQIGGAATCNYEGECGLEDPLRVCGALGQMCTDPDKDVVGDWQCVCVLPQTGVPGVTMGGQCVLDECTASCPTCAQVPGQPVHACLSHNQACEDPNTATGSTGDWECKCTAPEYGSATSKTAECHTDECESLENWDTCESAGQTCVDRDANVLGDWECTCPLPWTGQARSGRVALCELDECTAPADWVGAAVPGKNGEDVCSEALQTCQDPNLGKAGDWWCACPFSDAVMALAAVAPCKDESMLCAEFGALCRDAGQLCVEAEDGWLCQCVSPTQGMAVREAAQCTLDECASSCTTCAIIAGTNVCGGAGQRCIDDNIAAGSLQDWRCQCTQGRGSALTEAATCELDECAINSGVCEAGLQTCVDPNLNVESKDDWMCVCVAPAVGSAVGVPAMCTLDECITHASVCTEKGQNCIDQNQSPVSIGDWLCSCPPPASGTMVGQAATCKYTGGCNDEENSLVCIRAGQKCVPGDDTSDPNAWACGCVAPAVGEPAVQSPATCLVDECSNVCPTCAQKAMTEVNACQRVQQVCTDLDTAQLMTWQCSCPPPSSGSAMLAPVAGCDVDECAMLPHEGLVSPKQCGHFRRFSVDGCECQCGWQLPGAGGAGHQLPCTSGCCNPDLSAAGDWCIVDGDSAFNKNNPQCQPNARQVCAAPKAELPEGAEQIDTDVCQEAGQECVDPDMSHTSVNDWTCRCLYSAGSTALQPSDLCELDECVENKNICNDAGQECMDRDSSASTLGDWVCMCVGSGSGYKTAAVATCEYPLNDECSEHALTCGPSQYCEDPDTSKDGDWGCQCSAPMTGVPAVGGRALCFLDECTATCRSCANQMTDGEMVNVCLAAGQSCSDPNVVDHTGDWFCTCLPPAVGETVGKAAECTLDECNIDAVAQTCDDAQQECVDHNTLPTSSNDWSCLCKAPEMGSGVAGPAACTYDDCVDAESARACQDAGQRCFDPDTTTTARGDWVCKCATGSKELTPGIQQPAECQFAGECSDPDIAQVCVGAHQTCIDPDLTNEGDWRCVCVTPMIGTPALGEPALCTLNECAAVCPTCANGVCEQNDQRCEDFSAAYNDWVCMCPVTAGNNPGLQKPAVCSKNICMDVEDKGDCDLQPECMWLDASTECVPLATPPPTTTPVRVLPTDDAPTTTTTTTTTNESLLIAGAGEQDDDDCSFLTCWLWLILLLLCCCCCVLLVLLRLRQKRANADEDEEKWNKKFEQKVDGEDLAMMEDDEEDLIKRDPAPKEAEEDPATESLLGQTPPERNFGRRRESTYTPPNTNALTPPADKSDASDIKRPAPLNIDGGSNSPGESPAAGDSDDM